MFMAGALQSLLTMAFWLWELGGSRAGLYAPPSWPLPPVWAHAASMIFGLFPFFICGFLMTALPKWVGGPPVAARAYLPAFFMMSSGWLLFYLALLAPAFSGWTGASLVPVAVGWGWALRALVGTARQGVNVGKQHAWAALTANALGIAGLLAFAVGLYLVDSDWVRVGIETGVWCAVLPVFFIVSHRMLPFFSSTVIPRYRIYRPLPVLWLMLGCFAVHALAAMTGTQRYFWPVDLFAAGLAFFLSWKWQVQRSFAVPLLAMHHVATLWLGTALALYAAQGAAAGSGTLHLGLAPLHALTVGYFASMLIGMATRVTLGHSGRTVVTDRWNWGLFWLFQCVVGLRLAAEFFVWSGPGNLLWLAGLGWFAVFALWCRIHVPMYLKTPGDAP